MKSSKQNYVSFSTVADDDTDQTRDYIVFTDQPEGQDLRDYAIQILSAVLGSKEDAEKALGYVYRNVGPGFSARLTPKQALLLQNQPGVLYVKESEMYQLHPHPHHDEGQSGWSQSL
ncbi:OLC1v1015552C2 [Oldenlandia corymbosa var. corymbosa]|uniref:OLC1v1015552C2 n=1 Tax=Oldenlandia corymbosa var. corymbosa TaxID=529605 RepID=A0AAV1E3H3_OLDCO|nr:OLC1v1015552C2 [Oldenlandia corymbosa var. corymbosa]